MHPLQVDRAKERRREREREIVYVQDEPLDKLTQKSFRYPPSVRDYRVYSAFVCDMIVFGCLQREIIDNLILSWHLVLIRSYPFKIQLSIVAVKTEMVAMFICFVVCR